MTAMIGRGGMGVVARAVDQLLNREVAVKVLRTYTDAAPAELAELRLRMRREAQAAARIRHGGVVTVHDVVEEQGQPVIVMELVDGPSLDDVLTERGSLDPREAAAIGAKLMDALDAAHRAGVLHRDVKPGNVLLERGGRVVLTDFGIASMENTGDEALAKLTQSGQIFGSLDYLSPERAQGQPPSAASDIWALGMTLYAAVEGVAPFRRTSMWSTLAAIISDPLPEPRNAGPLTPVLWALMAKDPAQRPDAGQAREMLETVARGGTTALTPPRPVTPQQVPPPQAPPQAAPQQVAPEAVAPPAFGPPAATPPAFGTPGFGPAVPPPAPPSPQSAVPPLPAGAYAAPVPPGGGQPGMGPVGPVGPVGPGSAGTVGGSHSRSETRAATAHTRRRGRTVAAVAAATVLTCGGVTYAVMNMRNDEGGGAGSALPPGASTPADGDMSDAGGRTDGADDEPASPGDLTSMNPGETPSATPSQKAESPGASPTPAPGAEDAKPAGRPSASAEAKPSSAAKEPVKEPTPVSTGCTGWAHANSSNGTGHVTLNTHLYTGPYAECSWVTAVKVGTELSYDCYVMNAHANKWMYARVAETGTAGWVFGDKSAVDSGTLERCPD
ncbi:protein kinase [Streptomyces sp. NPDC048717]|uniref:protein kinase domain-containing protein n=1 Tax=Streptomyces sp. NPDC048717 TaxID=3154928 RepID=UPI00343109EC